MTAALSIRPRQSPYPFIEPALATSIQLHIVNEGVGLFRALPIDQLLAA